MTFPFEEHGVPKELTLLQICAFLDEHSRLTLLSTCKEGQIALRRHRVLVLPKAALEMLKDEDTGGRLKTQMLKLVDSKSDSIAVWESISMTDLSSHLLDLLHHKHIASVIANSFDRVSLSHLQEVRDVRLTNSTQLSDLSPLSKVKTLCIDRLEHVTDLSVLKHLESLEIKHMNQVLDVSKLYHLKHLTLVNAYQVIGMNALHSLEDLTLRCHKMLNNFMQYSYEISVVSSLKSLKSLWLEGIETLTSLPPLPGSLEKLDVSFCSNLVDISIAAHIPYIHIEHCENLVNVPSTISSRQLVIETCDSFADFTSLRYLHDIFISSVNLSDVSPLAKVYKLTLYNCQQVTDISPLSQVSCLQIKSCENVRDISTLSYVKELQIIWCINVIKFCRPLGEGQKWEIYSDQLRDLIGFEKLKSLILIGCTKLTDISSLSTLQAVELRRCDHLVDVSPLKNVHKVSLISCPAIRDISMLQLVRELYVSKCTQLDESCIEALKCIPTFTFISSKDPKTKESAKRKMLKLLEMTLVN